jgi:hypothetical protein
MENENILTEWSGNRENAMSLRDGHVLNSTSAVADTGFFTSIAAIFAKY